jgi:hypothetical protein
MNSLVQAFPDLQEQPGPQAFLVQQAFQGP